MDPENNNGTADLTNTPITSTTTTDTNAPDSVNADEHNDEHKDIHKTDSIDTTGTTKKHKHKHHHSEDGTEHHHHHRHHSEDGKDEKDSKHKHKHKHKHHDDPDDKEHHHHHHHDDSNAKEHHHHHDPNDKEHHHHHHHHKHSKAEQPQPQLANAVQNNDEQKAVDIGTTTTTTTTTSAPTIENTQHLESPSTTSPSSTSATSSSISSSSIPAESSAPSTISTPTDPVTSETTPSSAHTNPLAMATTITPPNIIIATTPSTSAIPTTTTIVVTNEAAPTEPTALLTTINITTEITPPQTNITPTTTTTTTVSSSSTMPPSALFNSPAVISGISIPLSGDAVPPPQQQLAPVPIQSEQRSTASSEINTTEDQMSDKPESQRASRSRVFSKKEWRQSMFLEPPMPVEHKKDRLRHHAKLAHKKNTLGETIYKGHPSWLLMRDIQTGLYTNIRSMATGQVEHPDLYFTPPVTVLPISANSSITFKFKDYCPLAFYKLREHFGINHVDYITSLCQNWNEVGTPGKSGSLFFFSLDNQYVLKTIPKREAKLLRSLLPAYYEYMTNHSDSLITRFMGLHRIKPHKGRQVRFLVMGNLFNSNLKVHQRFDLKGSTIGRELLPAERAKKNPTFKDLDFRRLNKKIHLGPNRDLFLKQLQLDCNFLSSLHVMDYSLLVGIHYLQENTAEDSAESEDELEDEGRSPPLNKSMGTLPPLIPDEETPPPNQALSCFEREEGGLRARAHDGAQLEEYYYIGVIDILMLYTARKQIEHAAKRIMHPRGEISSVDPEDFAIRFMKFMTEVVD